MKSKVAGVSYALSISITYYSSLEGTFSTNHQHPSRTNYAPFFADLFQQIVDILVGTSCAPFLVDLFKY